MNIEKPLTKDNLALMNKNQKEIILTQWYKHQHDTHEVDFDVSGENDTLYGFIISKGVWNPLLASGRYHARYLFYNTHLFLEKTAIEIGCGCGLMAVIMAKYGAKKIIANDISPLACRNTLDNVKKFKLQKKIDVVRGNLFENIVDKVDFITWMIPFFPGSVPAGDTISSSMIMPPELFKKFLKDAKMHLKSQGIILIPSYSLGGSLTDPLIVAPKFGYKVKRTWTHNSINGIQQGLLYIDELSIN